MKSSLSMPVPASSTVRRLLVALVAIQLGSAGPSDARFDPPRIIQAINPPNSGATPDSLVVRRRYYIDKGLVNSINRGDVLNVYREKRLSRQMPAIRLFIGTMLITDAYQGSSIGEFEGNAMAMSQPAIKYKTAMKGDIVMPRLIIDSAVLLDPGDSDLKPKAEEEFAKVAEFVRMFSPSRLVIEGHTDADGDQASNLKLSERRSGSIRQYLIKAYEFITPAMIESKGYGEARPIAANDTPENKALNRRIEVIVWE